MANCFEELRGETGFGQYGGPCHRKGSCFLPRSKAQGTGFHLHKLKGELICFEYCIVGHTMHINYTNS